MANTKIRGITIQLNADTKGVSDGLKKSNKEIKNTQSQLKDVERLLKLDPKNTELLAQKQKLVAQATKESKTKLKELHDLEKSMKADGIKKNSEEMMALRREIESTKISMDSYKDSAEKAGKTSFGDVAKGVAAGAAAVVGAAAAAGAAVVSMTNDTAAYADTVDKASIRMGVSAENYQRLAYAAGQSGVEMTVMEKAAKKLEGTGKTMDQAMAEVMSYGTAAERSAKAAELFGEMVAYNMSPLIEQSTEDYDALINRADELGLVMSGEDVKAGVKLGDTMSDVQQSFKMVVTQLGAKLVPVVQAIADKLLTFLPKFNALMDKLSPILAEMFDKIMPVLFDMADKILPPIMDLIEAMMPIITEICETLLPIFSDIIAMIVPFLVQLAQDILPIISKLLEIITPVLEKIAPILQPILQLIMDIIGPILTIIEQCIMPLVDWIMKIIGVVLEKLAPCLEVIGEKIRDFFQKIPEWAKKGLNAVIKFVNGMIDGINTILYPLRWVIQEIGNLLGQGWSMDNIQIPHIPMLAKGGILSSGSAIVGEAGPELLSVQGGKAVVQPLNGGTTNNYSSSMGGVTINVTQTDGENSTALAYRISEILADQYSRERAVFA